MADAERVVVTSGTHASLTVLAAALAPARVAVEDPGLPDLPTPWVTAGSRVQALPVDGSGAQVDLLGDDVTVCLLTPSHQFPLGVPLAAARRQQVVDWAGRVGGVVVEDDYDGEFRFDRRPIAALQRLAPDRVVHAGSVSKVLSPGVRLGWLVLPRDLVAAVTRAVGALGLAASVTDQLALAELIRGGRYEQHVRRQRRVYAARQRRVRDVAHACGGRVDGVPAGLHLVLRGTPLVEAADDEGVVEQDGLMLHALRRYVREHEIEPGLVVGFATPGAASFEPSLSALGQALLAGDRRRGG